MIIPKDGAIVEIKDDDAVYIQMYCTIVVNA